MRQLLDIIIPTYKNKEGLCKTLDTIPINYFTNIIVVDDCSGLNYDDIRAKYNYIYFYQLEENKGPGMARQYGIEHSNGEYILFLDTGDCLAKNGLETIIYYLLKDNTIKLYSWAYLQGDVIKDRYDTKMIGKVFQRAFLEKYHIRFSEEGSYANEDFGIIRSCELIFKTLGERENLHQHLTSPIFYEEYNPNSITKNNNNLYRYTKLIPGIIINGLHAIEITKQYLTEAIIEEELASMLALVYFYFLKVAIERPEYALKSWQCIRKFYLDNYIKFNKIILKDKFLIITLPKVKQANWKKTVPLNILRFIYELETSETPPIRYLT